MFKTIKAIILAALVVVLTNTVYRFTLADQINAAILRSHAAVAQLGDNAPLADRVAWKFSHAPSVLIDSIADILRIGRAHAQTQMTVDRGNMRNHQSVSCPIAGQPTVTGATKTSGSCDFRGQFTSPTTGSTTVTVTFGVAYAVAPWCTVTRSDNISTAGSSPFWTVSTTALTVTGVASNSAAVYNWICWGPAQ